MPQLDVKYVILFFTFVLPGAISMYVYGLLVPQAQHALKDQIVEAIAFSSVNFILLFGFIQLLFTPDFLTNNLFLSWLTVIGYFLLAPVMWPMMLLRVLRNLERRGWIKVQPKTAWDDFFGRLGPGCWIMVELSDGKAIGGRFSERSFANCYPDLGHIYIEELWKVRGDGTFGQRLPGGPDAILRPTDYKYLTINYKCLKVFEGAAHG